MPQERRRPTRRPISAETPLSSFETERARKREKESYLRGELQATRGIKRTKRREEKGEEESEREKVEVSSS